ncbi:MAG: CpsD/CapB family tyrosine-protein kinase, partial [Verrucomicrobiae bacterium]|nr:CpsD/CapB family tyrosine-protein kinase [Verrucomicrobiae bacterium]
TGLNGIGMIPLARKELLEDVHRSPAQGATVPNFLLETIRVIRSNICLRPNRNSQTQVVMVTSARPQEGKTSQAANLAWSFSSMGEKTLLLDCDLRRGRVHGFTRVSNELGMTHLLLGDCTPEQAIQPVGHRSSAFDIIPRGPVIAGTTEILCQKRFDDLIALFRQHYDRIVIDTPPVLGLSETSSLQRVCDGVVLVVRAEATSKKDVGDAVSILSKAGAHFFGFVLNAVDLSKASNYYNYYYYSAAYYDDFDDNAEDDGQTPTSNSPRPGRTPLPISTTSELGVRRNPAV